MGLAARDLLVFEVSALVPVVGSLGLPHQVGLVIVFGDDSPVRVVAAEWGLNLELSRQLAENFTFWSECNISAIWRSTSESNGM